MRLALQASKNGAKVILVSHLTIYHDIASNHTQKVCVWFSGENEFMNEGRERGMEGGWDGDMISSQSV